jgi:hypothetical protein
VADANLSNLSNDIFEEGELVFFLQIKINSIDI